MFNAINLVFWQLTVVSLWNILVNFDYISWHRRSSDIFSYLILYMTGLRDNLVLMILHLSDCSLVLLQDKVAVSNYFLSSSELLHVCLRWYLLYFLELMIVLNPVSVAHIRLLLRAISYQIVSNWLPFLNKLIILLLLDLKLWFVFFELYSTSNVCPKQAF